MNRLFRRRPGRSSPRHALIAVSLLTRPQPDDEIAGLTFATATKGTPSDPLWRRTDLLLSILLVIAVATIWMVFRG